MPFEFGDPFSGVPGNPTEPFGLLFTLLFGVPALAAADAELGAEVLLTFTFAEGGEKEELDAAVGTISSGP